MKKYRIKYKEHISGDVKYAEVIAQCSQDAVNVFFDNYSGMFLEIEFIDYV